MRLNVLMLALLVEACAPRLYVNVLRPAPVSLGAAKKLTVFEMQGRKSARDELLQELFARSRDSGYFTLSDRSDQGITLVVAARHVTLNAPQAADEVGLRLDVLDWNADKQGEPVKDKNGKVTSKEHWEGRVLVSVTAFNAAGDTFMIEREYKAQAQDEQDEDQAILKAAREVVSQLLEDITPSFEQKAIVFDDTEEGQRPIIDLASKGDVPRAMEAERALMAKSPNNAAAIFNLGVLLDSQGQYRDALPLYEQAIKLQPKDLYLEMLRECQQRLADADALSK